MSARSSLVRADFNLVTPKGTEVVMSSVLVCTLATFKKGLSLTSEPWTPHQALLAIPAPAVDSPSPTVHFAGWMLGYVDVDGKYSAASAPA